MRFIFGWINQHISGIMVKGHKARIIQQLTQIHCIFPNNIIEQATRFGSICGTPYYGIRTQIDHTYREAFPYVPISQVKADHDVFDSQRNKVLLRRLGTSHHSPERRMFIYLELNLKFDTVLETRQSCDKKARGPLGATY